MERGKRPIKQVTEETVVTISKAELVECLGKHSSRIIHDVVEVEDVDDAKFVLGLIALTAHIASDVCGELFEEDEE